MKSNEILNHCPLCNHDSYNLFFTKNGFDLVQCGACGLVYVSNPPSNEALKKFYSFETGYHFNYQDDCSKFKNENLRAIDHYNLIKFYKKTGRILDIGCSAGFFLNIAKNNGWDAYGNEISKDTGEIAQKRYGLNVFIGSVEKVDLPENFYDVVTLWDVIEHVEDPIRIMHIVHRILKDDGIAFFETPNIDGLFPKLSYKVANMMHYWSHPEPPGHLFQFSKKTFCHLLDTTGFDLLKIIDRRIPIMYSFISKKILNPLCVFYTIVFAPIAAIAPLFKMGDSMIVIANKKPLAA